MAVFMAKRRKAPHERFPRAWGEPGGPFPAFTLNDEQWNTVANLSGISADAAGARQELDNIIGRYRRFEVNDSVRVSSAETRREFDVLREDTQALLIRLLRLIENPDAHFLLTVAKQPDKDAPFPFPQTTQLEGHDRLENALTTLRHLADWLANAALCIEGTKSGPRAANVYWLVAALDAIREKITGLRISRSYKDSASMDYIAGVCRIANSNIGAGTIDAAMKDRIARRGRNNR